ncbi:MAG: CoA transferase [Rhodobacteraceae bacterium]|nr:CoA transferase [Paracoccaceae bacterium]
MMNETSAPPLKGLRILDLSTLLAGPMASTFLADFGAEVVKVELPGGKGDALRDLAPHKNDEPLWWKVSNRNKRAVTLDVRTKEGRELLLKILPKFDVLVENFRPGTMERYGLDCETLHAVNASLIILRVTGYGQTGPLSSQPGFARIAEAYSGFTYLCGKPDDAPMHVGFPVADAVTGLFGALSILIACFRKLNDKTNPGEVIDLSLVESMFRLMEFLPIEFDQLNVVRERSGTRSQYAGPSNIYRSSDNHWISMSASAQSVFERLMLMIDEPQMANDPRFVKNADRVANADALDAVISRWFSCHSRDDILSQMAHFQVAGGVVNSIADIFESDHFRAREAIVYAQDERLGPVAMPNVVPRMKNAPGAVKSVGPSHGQHNAEFWKETCNLDVAELNALRAKGVI